MSNQLRSSLALVQVIVAQHESESLILDLESLFGNLRSDVEGLNFEDRKFNLFSTTKLAFIMNGKILT